VRQHERRKGGMGNGGPCHRQNTMATSRGRAGAHSTSSKLHPLRLGSSAAC
jgi:hypothetical protein